MNATNQTTSIELTVSLRDTRDAMELIRDTNLWKSLDVQATQEASNCWKIKVGEDQSATDIICEIEMVFLTRGITEFETTEL